MNLLRYDNLYLVLSGFLIIASIASIAIFGLQLGIDFTGGSILEVEYTSERPSNQDVQERISGLDLGSPYVQSLGEKGVVIRMKDISEETHQEVLQLLGTEVEERKFESIGPVIGKELRDKALLIIFLALAVIVIYIAFAFRKITRPVKSWQWSVAALVAILHDVLIPLGILALLGEFRGIQITIPVVVALLTVAGYSINDTVVVFDRIRENLARKVGADFRDTVNKSLRQTLTRSINTSATTLIVVAAIFVLGGETLRSFSFTMIIGIVVGTYSSLFLAPVLLVKWTERFRLRSSSGQN